MDGRNLEFENNPLYILEAVAQGFDCEIDVWVKNGKYFLGHDFPKYLVEDSFLKNEFLWCHAKNIDALQKMSSDDKIHFFWHQKDDYTLTSKGYIWAYPSKILTKKSICVLPENSFYEKLDCAGICSDYIINYK